ncbi:hypothetical protein MA16_Dca023410 [Dendrobium catenatum]|uniref:Uncharacterized protein n=1 Tax=Dendrobium catenatum TaxID=906689 RepID=A0A2I0X2Q5_9ASPA|nr:hypothetical protein MA16_Dca023410 [Dendrobium catenatum]
MLKEKCVCQEEMYGGSLRVVVCFGKKDGGVSLCMSKISGYLKKKERKPLISFGGVRCWKFGFCGKVES